MISHFKERCRLFVWYLIVAFTICSVPHFELVQVELAGLLIGEAHAAQAYSAGSTRIAKVETEKVTYLHPDHLGSTSLVTDGTGAKVASQEYMPFGMARGANVASETNYQYTGQEYDAETGLYWYGSRYYDSVIGRFVMADTMVPDITDTQALNPYSYCLNNPLKYTDPMGHSVKDKKNARIAKDPVLNGFSIAAIVIGAVGIIMIIAGIICRIGGLNTQPIQSEYALVEAGDDLNNFNKAFKYISKTFSAPVILEVVNWVIYGIVHGTGEEKKEENTDVLADFPETK